MWRLWVWLPTPVGVWSSLWVWSPLPWLSQEEDLQTNMSSERRQASLEKKIQAVEEEIERQLKAKAGVEQLAKVYQEQPEFCDEKGAQDVSRQLVEVRGWSTAGAVSVYCEDTF